MGIQVFHERQASVRQLPQARHPFVAGIVKPEVFALQIWAALAVLVELCEMDLDVPGALADDQGIAS